MELRDLVAVLRRRWLTVLLGVVVGVGLASVSSALTTPLYASSARLFVSSSERATTTDSLQGAELSQRRVSAYADLATSRRLATEVKLRTGVETPVPALAGRVSAAVVGGTINLSLTYLDPDPAVARAVTQAYAESLVDLVRELETPDDGGTPPIRLTILDDASVPGGPVLPRTDRDRSIGLLLGLVLGLGLAFLRDHLDVSVRRREELDDHGAQSLGLVVTDAAARQRPLVAPVPGSVRDEMFRAIRTSLQFLDVDSPARALVVTSAKPSEGKTTVSIHLAFALAQAGRKVLLVEGDLRRSSIAGVLGVDGAVGLTGTLVGATTLDDAVQQHESGIDVLVAGATAPNPSELLESTAMATLVAELRQRYDVLIVDAPPLLPVSDGVVLAGLVDRAVLVVRHGRTTHEEVAACLERLAPASPRPTVSILSRVPRRKAGGRYGYGYGYAYGARSTRPGLLGRLTPSRSRR